MKKTIFVKTKTMIHKPDYKDAPAYCYPFFDLITSNDLLLELKQTRELTVQLFSSIDESRSAYRYASNKWSIAEVLRHIIECERVYSYRALRFSRFDATPLPGFDEEMYIRNVPPLSITILDLLQEYNAVRDASLYLFTKMNQEMLDFKGNTNNVSITARALGYMTAGHNLHHCNKIKELYL